jgi:hypothetical protein
MMISTVFWLVACVYLVTNALFCRHLSNESYVTDGEADLLIA